MEIFQYLISHRVISSNGKVILAKKRPAWVGEQIILEWQYFNILINGWYLGAFSCPLSSNSLAFAWHWQPHLRGKPCVNQGSYSLRNQGLENEHAGMLSHFYRSKCFLQFIRTYRVTVMDSHDFTEDQSSPQHSVGKCGPPWFSWTAIYASPS